MTLQHRRYLLMSKVSISDRKKLTRKNPTKVLYAKATKAKLVLSIYQPAAL